MFMDFRDLGAQEGGIICDQKERNRAHLPGNTMGHILEL